MSEGDEARGQPDIEAFGLVLCEGDGDVIKLAEAPYNVVADHMRVEGVPLDSVPVPCTPRLDLDATQSCDRLDHKPIEFLKSSPETWVFLTHSLDPPSRSYGVGGADGSVTCRV